MVGIRTWTLMALLEVGEWGVRVGRRESDDAGAGEGGVRRLDGGRSTHSVRDRVERLEAHARVDHDRLPGRVELAGVDELLQDADRRTTGGLGEDALVASEQQDAVAYLVVGDVLDGATRAAADVQDVGTVGRVSDRQALGDG